jgi:hypothetical protein
VTSSCSGNPLLNYEKICRRALMLATLAVLLRKVTTISNSDAFPEFCSKKCLAAHFRN